FSAGLRPPAATLFPYTTLFRSRSRVAVITESDGHIRVVPAIDVGCWRSYGSRRIGRGLIDADAADRRGIGSIAGLVQATASVGQDRNRTRMNSSHHQHSIGVLS